ncbi:MAG TPA: SsrA-binding protein SmpB [Longimicrobiales bacterium]|nr:SsrA-binding protein SmpB [Longimicrobiales bacterium]
MSKKTVARNKKALHEYHILDTYEAGIVLFGPEVKSIRAGKVSLAEAFARVDGSEAYLHGMHISPYGPASLWNVDPTRPRKLLLNRREIRKLIGATQQEGFTLVPLELYLKEGYVKVAIALGRGKKRFDKREDLKKRDAEREMQRAIRRG